MHEALGGEERSDEAPRAGSVATARSQHVGCPEVVAKHRSEHRSSQHGGARLRSSRRQSAARQPGEVAVGCYRRSGRGSWAGISGSHLTDWRKAQRQGSSSGPDPEQARSEARRAQPPQIGEELGGARARGESRRAAGPKAGCSTCPGTMSGRPGKSCRAAGIQPRGERGRTADRLPNQLASQVAAWRRRARALGVATGFLLPLSEARSEPGISMPQDLRPPGPCARHERAHGPRTDGSPARASSTGRRTEVVRDAAR